MRKKFLTWSNVKYLTICAAILQAFVYWIQSKHTIVTEKQLYNIPSIVENETFTKGKSPTVQNILHDIQQSSHIDASGEYKFILDIFMTKEKVKGMVSQENITVITHCSVDQLHLLPDLLHNWKGLISISVFITKKGAEAMFYLHRCYPDVRKYVTFNVIFPSSMNLQEFSNLALTCEDSIRYSPEKSFELDFIYPINLMRNVARMGASSLYHFLIDVDMVPNQSLRADAHKYLGGEQHKALSDRVVYVIPAYELNKSTSLPANKRELLNLRSRNRVRPFYQELCDKCQKRTDYPSWEHDREYNASFRPLYEVTWSDSWEPFYISHSDVPSYDERFRQYGFNRISQICELHLAGYSFLVQNSGFLLHRGWKTNYSHHKSKRKELLKNLILYESFKQDLYAKYSHSSSKC